MRRSLVLFGVGALVVAGAVGVPSSVANAAANSISDAELREEGLLELVGVSSIGRAFMCWNELLRVRVSYTTKAQVFLCYGTKVP